MGPIDADSPLLPQGDIATLARRLERRPPRPEALSALFEAGEPWLHLALEHLLGRLASPLDRATLEACAALLPRASTPRWPETDALLAEAYAALFPCLASPSLPPWRERLLPPASAIAWARAELQVSPGCVGEGPSSEELVQALSSLDIASVHEPQALLGRLIGHDDSALRQRGLALLRQGLHAAVIAPSKAHALFRSLLDSPSPSQQIEALSELGRPWALGFPLPSARLLPLARAPHPEVARAAAALLAARGEREALVDLLGEETADPPCRRHAIRGLGQAGEAADIEAMIAAAARSPRLLAGPLEASLLEMHRRGCFVPPGSIAPLLSVFVESEALSAPGLATLTFTARRAVLEELSRVPGDDRAWRRLASLVEAMASGPAGPRLGPALGRLLLDKLLETTGPASRAPLVHALGRACAEGDPEAEAALLWLLPEHPSACLDSLARIGTEATAMALGWLVAEACEPPMPLWLRPHRTLALELHWHLSPEGGPARRSLLEAIDPSAIPPRIAADLAPTHDETALSLLAGQASRLTPEWVLERLCRSGGERALPRVPALLMAVVARVDRGELSADVDALHGWEPSQQRRPPARPPASEADSRLPPSLDQAIRALGAELFSRGKPRPRFLMEATSRDQAGEALLAELLLSIVERPDASAGEVGVALRSLPSQASGKAWARVAPLLRHRDRGVRKQAIARLSSSAAAEAAASLTALLSTDDLPTLRQAIEALGRARARGASAAIARCLEHGNMNIKKAAADALAAAGDERAVPALLSWLGRHDNPGLRSSIIAALRAITGPAYAATVLSAASTAEGARSVDLLLQALDGELRASSVRSLVRQEVACAGPLLASLASGSIRLASGSLSALSAELEGAGLSQPRPGPSGEPGPLRQAIDALVERGFDPGLGARLLDLADAPLDHAELEALRPFLPGWLSLVAPTEGALGPRAERAVDLLLALHARSPLTEAELRACRSELAPLRRWLIGEAGDSPGRRASVLLALGPALGRAEALLALERLRAIPRGTTEGARELLRLVLAFGSQPTGGEVAAALSEAEAQGGRSGLIGALGEVFGEAPPASDDPRLEAVDEALLDPSGAALERLRTEHFAASSALLGKLLSVFPESRGASRASLLSWLLSQRPPGLGRWGAAERDRVEAEGPAGLALGRAGHASAEQLRGVLEAGNDRERDEAAEALLGLGACQPAVLEAFLAGRARPQRHLASLARSAPIDALTEAAEQGPEARARVAELSRALSPDERVPLLPLLVSIWERREAKPSPLARWALQECSADLVADLLLPHLEQGRFGYLELIGGKPLSTPALEAIAARAEQASGHRLSLSPPAIDRQRRAAIERSLAEQAARPAPRPGLADEPRASLLAQARGPDVERARKALTELARRPDDEVLSLLEQLLEHREARVRLHACRLLRERAPRERYLAAAERLLDDPLPAVRRSAVKIASHGQQPHVVERLVSMLGDPDRLVRREAESALERAGEAAMGPLRRAAARARPDRRAEIERLLARLISAP